MQTVYRELIDRRLPFEDRACLTKVHFVSRREARSLVRHGRHQDGTLEPYRCRLCGDWHLGHGRSGRARRLARRDAALTAEAA